MVPREPTREPRLIRRRRRAWMSLACFAIETAFCVSCSSHVSASLVFRSLGPSWLRKILYASRILPTAPLESWSRAKACANWKRMVAVLIDCLPKRSSQTASDASNHLRESVYCLRCWSITAALFIVVIESGWLAP